MMAAFLDPYSHPNLFDVLQVLAIGFVLSLVAVMFEAREYYDLTWLHYAIWAMVALVLLILFFGQ